MRSPGSPRSSTVTRPGDLQGCVEPGRILLACSDVLLAAGDPRSAEVAAAISGYLADRVAAIDDDDLRRGFLEQAPINVALATRARPEGRVRR